MVLFLSFFLGMLLVYREAIDFCVLILYSITVLNVFIICSSFLIESLWPLFIESSYYLEICILWHFPFLFISSLSYLIVAAKTWSTILNRCGETGYPCLVPDLVKMPWIFLHLVYFLYYIGIIPVLLDSLGLLSSTDVGICQKPFLHLGRWSCSFCHWVYLCGD